MILAAAFVGVLAVLAVVALMLMNKGNSGSDSQGPGPGDGSSSNVTGKLLKTLLESVDVDVRAGTGAGKQHALNKKFAGSPFPMRDAAVAAFDIRFAPGYEWGCQGKIGGLSVGPGESSGGRYSRNGASHRLMWDDGGGAFAYVYIPEGTEGRQPSQLGKNAAYGQGVWKSDFRNAFTTGKWHHVELGVKLNSMNGSTPNADGKLMLSIDGKTRVLGGVIWRQIPNLAIEEFGLGIFHGGPCSASKNSSLSIKNLAIHEWKGR